MKGFKKINFSSGDINIPLYKETRNLNGWINFGEDNLMPEYYLGLLHRSSKHNAIVNTKTQLIAGNGWLKQDLSNEALVFLKNAWGECDLDEVVQRCAYDFEIFGAFSLEVIWSENREKISAINHIPVNKVRVKLPEKDEVVSDGFYICNNWGRYSNNPIAYIPKFSTINRKETNQLLYFKKYTPGAETYGIPAWMSGARWMELEYEISNFHLQAAKNGFTPGLHINIPYGIPDEDAIDREINRLRMEFEGTNNANAPFITFSEGPESKIEINSLDMNASDSRFIELNNEITEGIMTAHQVTSPQLFGIMQEGMMINKNATITDLQQFQAQYITPKQNYLEKAFSRLAAINGVGELFLNKYELDYDVELAVADLLAVVQSPIPDSQKEQILITCGYRPEEAVRLIESGVSGVPGNEAPVEMKGFKTIYGNTRTGFIKKTLEGPTKVEKSSNVWKFKYDDKSREFVVKFQDGETYTYYDVPMQAFISVVEGWGGECKTEGESEWGSWYIGKSPSVGAAVWDVLVDGGYRYEKKGDV